MICRIKGKSIKQEENRVIIDSGGGMCYEINIPRTVYHRLNKETNGEIELVIYHYFNIKKNRGIPVLIGFIDELERDFFEKFIEVGGIGPKAALRAFDKPIPHIAQAIEEENIDFLKSLDGIGSQKAKQIIAHLQGKVGRFVLLKEEAQTPPEPKKELVEQAKQILRRLQYSDKEIEEMIKKALAAKGEVANIEELLNEIYRQRK